MMTAAERKSFLEQGFVILKGCFSRETAKKYTDNAYKRLGCSPNDPKSWPKNRETLPGTEGLFIKDFAPKAWEAVLEATGSADRIKDGDRLTWSDSFVIKFPIPDPKAWSAPDLMHGGWHKDGPHEKHYLDSPETGLILYVLWSDIKPRGGGTFLCPGSIPLLARHLAEHPEGLLKEQMPCGEMVSRAKKLVELTGEPGDVAIVHPFMLHSESPNSRPDPRFFTVRIVELKEPMRFDRPAAELSLVERATLRALGKTRYAFRRR